LLWAALNAVAFAGACARWWRAAGGERAAWWVAPAGALVISPFLAQHLIFHQVYALIFALLVEAFLAAQARRDPRAGLFIGVAGALKVTPALLLPWFLLRRRWKVAGVAAGAALLCALSLVPFLGVRGTIAAHRTWVARASALRGTHGIRNQSIEAFVERLTTGEAKLEQAGIDPLVRLSQPAAGRLGKWLSWALLLLACFLLREVEPVRALPALAAISVLAVPYCWLSQYIALGPLILVSLVRLSSKPDVLSCILRAPFFLCMVLREPALIGTGNFELLEGAGLTCFVSLLLIADALRVRDEPSPGTHFISPSNDRVQA
ncbi:MAG: glycosyltransferase family 87 protein, partial [Myxococcales bacterium]